MKRIATILSLILVSPAMAATLHVSTTGDDSHDGSKGNPFATIQHAIHESNHGDTISIAAGTYHEHTIDPMGKAITIKGSPIDIKAIPLTTIDAQQHGSVFYVHTDETPATVIMDLEIKNGLAHGSGGGIICVATSPTIHNCFIQHNTADVFGGGISFDGSNPPISRCTIQYNTADAGGGIHCDESHPLILDCLIQFNTASAFGGGFFLNLSNPLIEGCVFISNTAHAPNGGGAIWAHASNPGFSGCGFYSNSPPAIFGTTTTALVGGTEIGHIFLQDCVICGNVDGKTQVQVLGPVMHTGENYIHPNCDLNNGLGDLNGDGCVNGADLSILLGAWGGCP